MFYFKSLISFFLLSFVIVSASFATIPQKQLLDYHFERAQKKYKNVRILVADFEQRQKTLGETKISHGKLMLKRPSSFRWETQTPDRSLLISNGKKFWFYTPPFQEGEKGQVMIKASADVQSQLALDLLSARADVQKSFHSKVLEPGHYELKPLKELGNIQRLELFVEKSTNILYKVVLLSSTGNETELTLKNVVLMGPKQAAESKISDREFMFTVPKNTEEIH